MGKPLSKGFQNITKPPSLKIRKTIKTPNPQSSGSSFNRSFPTNPSRRGRGRQGSFRLLGSQQFLALQFQGVAVQGQDGASTKPMISVPRLDDEEMVDKW